jgi:DNA mismatch endonuclease, patch repair protein
MRSIRSHDTKPERVIRSLLHSRGYRFRKHARNITGSPDIVFSALRVAVFVDGDFWHGYRFAMWSAKLAPYWKEKIERNRARDRRNFASLRRSGWKVLRIWEHEIRSNPLQCADRVEALLEAQRGRLASVRAREG